MYILFPWLLLCVKENFLSNVSRYIQMELNFDGKNSPYLYILSLYYQHMAYHPLSLLFSVLIFYILPLYIACLKYNILHCETHTTKTIRALSTKFIEYSINVFHRHSPQNCLNLYVFEPVAIMFHIKILFFTAHGYTLSTIFITW